MPPRQTMVPRSKKSRQLKSMLIDDRVMDFLKFAPEIRNRVYDYVCVKPTYIGSNDGKAVATARFYKDAAMWRNLAFATSCKQIYIESSHVFYSRNGFEFSMMRPLLEFLEAVGLGGRILLTKLRFIYCTFARHTFIPLRYLKSCKNLQELEVYVQASPGWGYPLMKPIQFFLSDLTKVDFGESQPFGTTLAGPWTPTVMQADELRNSRFLIDSLNKIKSGEDAKFGSRKLPDVFAENGHSSAYLCSKGKVKRKSEAEEAKRHERISKLNLAKYKLEGSLEYLSRTSEKNKFGRSYWYQQHNVRTLKEYIARLGRKLGIEPCKQIKKKAEEKDIDEDKQEETLSGLEFENSMDIWDHD